MLEQNYDNSIKYDYEVNRRRKKIQILNSRPLPTKISLQNRFFSYPNRIFKEKYMKIPLKNHYDQGRR